ncbi:PilN domain-containing protein [Actinoplanes sp. NPDC049681]|uniref:PilN domain-containing protein n=1 Tax=Actinoplanes sp. NPDC049681 TaxID=3363905 RepID=UPI00379CEF3A
MATTLMPVDPAVTTQRINRVLNISASLLPEEIVAGRRARRVRTWVIVIVIIVAGLCGAWIVAANRDKQAADEDLTAATTEVAKLQRAQDKYATVVQLRNETDLLKGQLKSTMANDLDWADLLTMLRTTGDPVNIDVTGINGSVDDAEEGSKSSSAGTLPSTSESDTIGSVTVTGTAPDKQAVAAYVDALAQQTKIANPYVTSVTTSSDKVSFSLSVDITRNALCGRFGDPCKSTGGK